MDNVIAAELQVIVVLLCAIAIIGGVYANAWLLAKLVHDVKKEIRLTKTEGWGRRGSK